MREGYIRTEYIETTGAQYFDTDFNPTGNTQVEIVCQYINDGTTQQALFGSRPNGHGGTANFACFTNYWYIMLCF